MPSSCAPTRQYVPSFDHCTACIVGAHERCAALRNGHCECTNPCHRAVA